MQGYETWVNYWMPVTYTGIGLHDLNRSAYGGDIYINNGSHGCINLPLDVAKKIYDKVTINSPVMIVPSTTATITTKKAYRFLVKPYAFCYGSTAQNCAALPCVIIRGVLPASCW